MPAGSEEVVAVSPGLVEIRGCPDGGSLHGHGLVPVLPPEGFTDQVDLFLGFRCGHLISPFPRPWDCSDLPWFLSKRALLDPSVIGIVT